MIGKIYYCLTPFYNSLVHKKGFKGRPVLIIGIADSGDFNVLPVPRITSSINIDHDFDIPIDPVKYPKLGLSDFSYIRVHKQTTVNRGDLANQIGDMKVDYDDLYLSILTKLEEYNIKLINDAL